MAQQAFSHPGAETQSLSIQAGDGGALERVQLSALLAAGQRGRGQPRDPLATTALSVALMRLPLRQRGAFRTEYAGRTLRDNQEISPRRTDGSFRR